MSLTLKKKYFSEVVAPVILGISLGTGYMTSFRFLGPVGVSELLVLILLFWFFKKHGLNAFRFSCDVAGALKFYMFFSVWIVFPITTSVVYFLTAYDSDPLYLISFIMGVLLAFFLVHALDCGFNMRRVAVAFAITFIISNLITMLFFPSYLETARYSGGANNPNQLLFYASSLTMLLVIYERKLFWFFMPVISWIMFKTGSDAYLLTLAVVCISYLWFKLFFSSCFTFGVNLLMSLVFFLSAVSILLYNFADELVTIWSLADEGGLRVSLMQNAFFVTLHSPLVGFGAGSFSGVQVFGSMEAHNTFLDLSMQFGFLVPLIIYYVFFGFFLNRIKQGLYLQAAFVASFIVSGLFHFSGRHFVFWVEFAIFYYYVFYTRALPHSNKVKNKECSCVE